MTDTPDVIRDWLTEDSAANATLFAAVGNRVWWDEPNKDMKDAQVDHVIIKNLTESTPWHNAQWEVILQVECYPTASTVGASPTSEDGRALFLKVMRRLHGQHGTVDSGEILEGSLQTSIGIVRTPEGLLTHVSKYNINIQEEGS